MIRIPTERIAVLIGKNGKTKSEIEEASSRQSTALNPKLQKHAYITIYLPVTLFSKIGVKDEHFLPDLAQRLCAF